MTNARQIALELLNRVRASDSYINLLLPKELAKHEISDADRGLVQELSYGVLRWQLQYDGIIDQLTPGKTLSPALRAAIQLGLHQLFRMRVPTHAAINETVDLVKGFETSAAGLANAVLRNAERAGQEGLLATLTEGRDELTQLSIEYSHPKWIISGMQSALELDGRKSELRELLAANNQIPIVNLIAITSAASAKLDELGLERGSASPKGYLATGNPLQYLSIPGVRVQDQGSQLVALALSAVADKTGTWLDMCSGPGGKAAVLEDAVSGSGHLVCYEPHVKRAKLVTAALKDPENTPVLVNRGQDAPENSFAAVLLDAPCAGLGSLRRKPESRWTKTPEQLPSLTKLQSELLDAAVLALEPGGLLMYATCSPLIVETNSQIRAVLDRHANISLVDLVPVMQKLSPGLELNSARKTIQLWPHRHGTDAMFMALLKKDDGT